MQQTIDGRQEPLQAPYAAEEHETLRLFAPAPVQIPGQLDIGALLEEPAPAPVPSGMTRRERRERKAERLRDFAERREARQGDLDHAARADEAATGIPFGQPILRGHHSQRRHERAIERLDRAMGAAVDNARKADSMRCRADEIERQADTSIYSDDVDAVERLRAKLEELEAQRERFKSYNASCRKAAKTDGVGDTSILTPAERADLASTARHCAYMLGAGGQLPKYKLANLSGVISTTRKRLEELRQPERPRRLTAKYGGECERCGANLDAGTEVLHYSRAHVIRCVSCG